MDQLLLFQVKNLVADYIAKSKEIVYLDNASTQFKKDIVGIAEVYALLISEIESLHIYYSSKDLSRLKDSLQLSVIDLEDFIADNKKERILN